MVVPDLAPKREATFCWERGRLVRTERVARKLIGYELSLYLAKKHARLRRGASEGARAPSNRLSWSGQRKSNGNEMVAAS
jgi:hypothetical protein